MPCRLKRRAGLRLLARLVFSGHPVNIDLDLFFGDWSQLAAPRLEVWFLRRPADRAHHEPFGAQVEAVGISALWPRDRDDDEPRRIDDATLNAGFIKSDNLIGLVITTGFRLLNAQ